MIFTTLCKQLSSIYYAIPRRASFNFVASKHPPKGLNYHRPKPHACTIQFGKPFGSPSMGNKWHNLVDVTWGLPKRLVKSGQGAWDFVSCMCFGFEVTFRTAHFTSSTAFCKAHPCSRLLNCGVIWPSERATPAVGVAHILRIITFNFFLIFTN